MISIAMTTYNGEKYLREQLDSILNQTYKDFELIICDDCSTDSTVQIIKSYIDPRIKLFINEKNLGFKKNFEKAIKLCTGDYIALSDQDDIWEKDHLKNLYDNINNANLICGNNLLINAEGIATGIDFFNSHLLNTKFYNSNYKIFLKILFSGGCFQGASMLMTKNFAHKYIPIPENIQAHDLWFSTIALLTESFVCTSKIVTKYRQHDLQITKKKNAIDTQRIILLNELTKIITLCENDIFDFLLYFTNINSFFGRLKVSKLWYRFYFYIYPDRKKSKIFIRFIKFIFNIMI